MLVHPNFKLLPQTTSAGSASAAHLPRAADVILNSKRKWKERLQDASATSKKRKAEIVSAPWQPRPKCKGPSIIELLTKTAQEDSQTGPAQKEANAAQHAPSPVLAPAEYVKQVKKQVARGSGLHSNPWIYAPDVFKEAARINKERQSAGKCSLNEKDIRNLILRPTIFIWDPEHISPGLKILCPFCNAKASRKDWSRDRVLHSVDTTHVYVTVKYACRRCKQRANGSKMSHKTFLADAPSVLMQLPQLLSSWWQFVDTGRTLCDAYVASLIRNMALKTSWRGIADAMQEQRKTHWAENVLHRCSSLFDSMGLDRASQVEMPERISLTDQCIKNIFLADFKARDKDRNAEFAKEVGDDILRADWTNGAAARCGAKHLLNILDGAGRILWSQFTVHSKPSIAREIFERLAQRGVCPKVVYVDEECCGAWTSLLSEIWPSAHVRLDSMHAISRLTQTVTSTQHPLHSKFCSRLSAAIYSPDAMILERLNKAWARAGTCTPLPRIVQRQYVPRQIRNPDAIAKNLDAILKEFAQLSSSGSNPYFTDATHAAWASLKKHVLKGCLCDPDGVSLNRFGKNVEIAGEYFPRVHSLRGTSPVEGLHAHQKEWLGTFGQHAPDVGSSLLTEGALRWNRNKCC